MCGIAGVYLKGTPDREFIVSTLRGFDRDLYHRGPDSSGTYITERYGFLARRLAIVGREGGDQPIFDADRHFGIVYNGEIYNYRELTARYERRGANFHTATDTEAVLQSFVADGVDSFARLDGMFAFCVWDLQSGNAWVARDPSGIKPLYIYEDDRMVLFASELSALLQVPGIDRSLDRCGIRDYLSFRYVNAPYTVFRRIRRVPAGGYVRLSAAGCRHHSFVGFDGDGTTPTPLSYHDAQAKLRELLRAAVKSQLIGEVPMALLLSGGIDSSILAALLHQLGTPLAGFNIGFPEVNEFAYADAVAERYGFPVHNIEIEPASILDRLGSILRCMDEPIADAAQLPLFLLFEHVKQHATVVLSGDGADEIFAGYPQYGAAHLDLFASDPFPNFLRLSHYFLDNNEPLLTQAPTGGGWRRTRKYFCGNSLFRAMSNYDLATWLPEDLMMKTDKMGMRYSLEGRFPFLDTKLLNFAKSLPTDYLIGPDGTTKRILRDTFADLVPESVLSRPKMGFTVPIDALLRGSRDFYFDALAGLRGSELADILDLDKVGAIFTGFLDGDRDSALRNWTLFMLCAWMHHH